jgi:hypothetical protein
MKGLLILCLSLFCAALRAADEGLEQPLGRERLALHPAFSTGQ